MLSESADEEIEQDFMIAFCIGFGPLLWASVVTEY
jgi:hypothetical protein